MSDFVNELRKKIAPVEHIKLLEKLRDALRHEITLDEDEIAALRTELTIDGAEKEGVYLPAYKAELERRQLDYVQENHFGFPTLPEFLELDEVAAT